MANHSKTSPTRPPDGGETNIARIATMPAITNPAETRKLVGLVKTIARAFVTTSTMAAAPATLVMLDKVKNSSGFTRVHLFVLEVRHPPQIPLT